MASGGNEHRMLFDLRRGRRRTAVKVVYAILAVLMGLSLFLVVGPLNIGEIFSNNTSSSGEVAKPYEEQAERLEAKLAKDPENPDFLASLTRARVTAGNSLLSSEPQEEDVANSFQQYEQASAAWSEYLEATDEPSAGIAQLMAPAFVALAESTRELTKASKNINAATEAQQIVAKQRPTLNSWFTLALYTYFTGDFAAAEKAQAEAKKLASAKFEREQIDQQLKEVKKRAAEFQKSLTQLEAAEKAAAKANKGNPEALSNQSNPLSGAFGGGGLGE